MIIEKPQLDFFQRLKLALQSQSMITTFMGLFMIIVGVLYNDHVKGIMLVALGTSYLLLQVYWAIRVARTYIYKIENTENGAIIHYQQYKQTAKLVISVNQHFYRTLDKSRYSLKQIHLVTKNKTLVKQYACSPWEEKDIENLEKELKRIGFKKPYGENL